tara:strand:- start:2796 stop:3020 length:225 start_codon:yes stop_codon:yes gene_type:complete
MLFNLVGLQICTHPNNFKGESMKIYECFYCYEKTDEKGIRVSGQTKITKKVTKNCKPCMKLFGDKHGMLIIKGD